MKPSILVVDDNRKTCSNLKRILQRKNFHVEVTYDGAEALEKLEQNLPACMLLDIRMPGMNGVGAFKLVQLKYPDLKVIILTAVRDPNTKKSFLEKGAFAFIGKPVMMEQLFREIDLAIGSKKPSA